MIFEDDFNSVSREFEFNLLNNSYIAEDETIYRNHRENCISSTKLVQTELFATIPSQNSNLTNGFKENFFKIDCFYNTASEYFATMTDKKVKAIWNYYAPIFAEQVDSLKHCEHKYVKLNITL